MEYIQKKALREMAGSVQGEWDEGQCFIEFRRKVRDAEVLSASVERLARSLHFSGRVSVQFKNGRVLKCGYEEGYFRQHPGEEETE